MNDKPAAAFVRIKNRLINLVAICSILWHDGLKKLVISFGTGERLELKDADDVKSFLTQIAPFEQSPEDSLVGCLPCEIQDLMKPIPEPTGTAPPADDPDPESADDPGDDNSGDGDDDPGTGDETETDDEPSELELAGLPADVAALLHAGGIDTVEAVLTHPDLTQVEGIGANRKDKILKILKT